MQSATDKLLDFFNSATQLRFLIPIYQRHYAWREEQCEQLWTDLTLAHNYPANKNYFIGSIITQGNAVNADKIIIDGQQRLTTFSLFFLALTQHFKQVPGTNNPTLAMLNAYLSIDKNYLANPTDRPYRLCPASDDDRIAFDHLIEGKALINDSQITKNFLYFAHKIQASQWQLQDFWDVLQRLTIVHIKIEGNDDAQAIFESLNATGAQLTEADKLRNYLLISASNDENEMNQLYHKWLDIETAITVADLSNFVKDYLTMKKSSSKNLVREKEVYNQYKNYAHSKGGQKQIDLLNDLYYFAILYRNLVHHSFGTGDIDLRIKQLNQLQSRVTYPFLMAFFDYAQQTALSLQEQVKVLDLLANFWGRRIICAYPSSAITTICRTLHNDILEQLKSTTGYTYSEVMKYMLLQKTGTSKFPNDAEVRLNFATRSIYQIPAQYRLFIMERLENLTLKPQKDIEGLIQSHQISIEHIMPQELSPNWKKDLGDDWERIQNTYEHTMANLTFTAYNSNLGNETFEKKLKHTDSAMGAYIGYKSGYFRLNQTVMDCKQWGETELQQRQEALVNDLFNLWPMPTTTFQPIVQVGAKMSLNNSTTSFTNKRLKAFYFDGVKYDVVSWKEMLLQICQLLYAQNKDIMETICANDRNSCRNSCHNKADGYTEFMTGKEVRANCSTHDKIVTLKGLFKDFGLAYDKLEFEFRPTTDSDNAEESNDAELPLS